MQNKNNRQSTQLASPVVSHHTQQDEGTPSLRV
jgi:hypothetical protein